MKFDDLPVEYSVTVRSIGDQGWRATVYHQTRDESFFVVGKTPSLAQQKALKHLVVEIAARKKRIDAKTGKGG